MPNILQVPIPTATAAVVWPSRASGVNSLLFINQDLNNTIWIGQQSSITAAGPNTIPIVPNGTFSGDAASPWYVIGSAAGTASLVVVPNGQAYFLGLTQGLGKLVIPQIQSPNFSIAGQTGWAIMKNGDAYFFNIVAQGTITATSFIGTDFIIDSAGEFFYNGPPALGNLLLSITNAAGTDGEGNAYQQGVTLYNGTAYAQLHVNGAFGAPAFEMITGVASEAEHAALYSAPVNTGLPAERLETWLFGGGSTHDNTQPALTFQSAAANGSQNAFGYLGMITNSGFTSTSFWDTTGFQCVAPGGNSGFYANGTMTDASTHTVPNTVNSGGAGSALSVSYPIDANTCSVATQFEVEVPFTGTEETSVLNFGIFIDSTFTNIVPVAGSAITAGHGFAGTVKAKLTFTAIGSGGLANVDFSGEFQDASISRTTATSLTLNGHHAALAIDTTAAHVVTVAAFWTTNVAGETISGLGSVFRRMGQ